MAAPQLLPAEGRALRAMGHRSRALAMGHRSGYGYGTAPQRLWEPMGNHCRPTGEAPWALLP